MRFDYYYGSQADQFSFIRIPRVMIKDPVFAVLSAYAKLLYSVLLDRMSLSSKNGWFDEENRVYIVYPVTEAQADLGIGKKKAMEVIAELVDFGLLEKKRRGQGLPSLLYAENVLFLDSLILSVLSAVWIGTITGIHPVFCILIGIAVLAGTMLLYSRRWMFWIFTAVSSMLYGCMIGTLLNDITNDCIWGIFIGLTVSIITLAFHVGARVRYYG